MANTKQFGLSGVGSDIQLGKSGGRFVFDQGVFKAAGSDGVTLVNMRGAAPVNANDLTTKAYVDSLSSGLDPKESVRAATTAAITLSGVQTIDGVSVIAGNRVLVKNQADPVENGIYVVVDGGAWTRSTDMDGSPASEISGGNFTFVEQGTLNANSGFVLEGDGVVDLSTGAKNWVQFSGAGSIEAGAGIKKTGAVLSLDLFDTDQEGPLPAFAGTVAGADLLVIGDASDSSTQSVTIDQVLNDLDVVKGISADGILVRTANDTYASRAIVADGAGSLDGLTVTDGSGAAGDITVGLDITGNAARSSALLGTDAFLAHNGLSGANEKFTFSQMITDLAVVTDTGVAGLLVSDGAGSYSSATVTASAVAGDEGISVTGGATAPVIGLDITGLTAEATEVVAGDEFVMYDGVNNLKVTAQQIKDFAQAGLSQNSIEQLNSSVTVTDTAADGTIAIVADGSTIVTVTSTGTQFAGDVKLAGASEIDNGVVHVLADGTLETTAGFTFDGTDMAIPGALTAVGAVTAASFTDATLTDNAMLSSTSGEIRSETNVTFALGLLDVTGAIAATGDITSSTGNIASTLGSVSAATTVTAGTGLTVSSLTQVGGIAFSDASGVFSESANLTFDGTTLATTGLDVTGIITIDNITIDGNTISTTDTNGNLILAPNGTGEVVIGNAGVAAQLVAEDDQDLTLSGGDGVAAGAGTLSLLGGTGTGANAGGDVVVAAGTSGSGTAGTTQLRDSNDNLVAEILNTTAGTDGHIDFTAGANLAVDGTAANIDLALVPKGTGQITVPASYVPSTDDSLVDKLYVDTQVANNVTPGSVGSITAVIDLTSATAQAVGTIPANATVYETRVSVTATSNVVTTVNLGDATNGATSYMTDAEIDAQVLGLYSGDAFVTNGGTDVTANATVAVAGATGSATVMIFYRNQ